MTILEVRQQKKNEALNSIRKIYNPKYKFPYSPKYNDDMDNNISCGEEREQKIKGIIEDLEKELLN